MPLVEFRPLGLPFKGTVNNFLLAFVWSDFRARGSLVLKGLLSPFAEFLDRFRVEEGSGEQIIRLVVSLAAGFDAETAKQTVSRLRSKKSSGMISSKQTRETLGDRSAFLTVLACSNQ